MPFAGASDDPSFFLFVARIQDLMRNSGKRGAQTLGLLHAGRPHQNRPAGGVKTFDDSP